MNDTAGNEMRVGDFIIYCQAGYHHPKLYFGRITRMNETTNKLWIHHMEHDRKPLMKMVHDASRGGWQEDEFEEVGISLVNYSDSDRFYIL